MSETPSLVSEVSKKSTKLFVVFAAVLSCFLFSYVIYSEMGSLRSEASSQLGSVTSLFSSKISDLSSTSLQLADYVKSTLRIEKGSVLSKRDEMDLSQFMARTVSTRSNDIYALALKVGTGKPLVVERSENALAGINPNETQQAVKQLFNSDENSEVRRQHNVGVIPKNGKLLVYVQSNEYSFFKFDKAIVGSNAPKISIVILLNQSFFDDIFIESNLKLKERGFESEFSLFYDNVLVQKFGKSISGIGTVAAKVSFADFFSKKNAPWFSVGLRKASFFSGLAITAGILVAVCIAVGFIARASIGKLLVTSLKPIGDLKRDILNLESDKFQTPLPLGGHSEIALIRESVELLRQHMTQYFHQITDFARTAAIARTTQSLAHDVRKPFSMFKMIIDAVEGEDDPVESKQLLKESLPEVQQAMASVNGMIADVLEIGSESEPIAEATNPETLIEITLNEIFRVYPDSKINVSYVLNHQHKVNVDALKIGRVFSNIVGNAVQAMNQKGELWFKTEEFEENGRSLIKFCLGNGGSFIPPESLSKLFDAFFTSGKKGGTGLGLAIAQKIVTAHGGKIWCESDAQRGVEFFFTLPCAKEWIDERTTPLPTSSNEITATFERLRKSANSNGRVEADPLEVTLEKEIIKLAKAAGSPLKVLVVDDESVYRNSLAALINRSNDLKAHISLSIAKNSTEALEGAKSAPALVIQDVDLGANSLNGYEVLKTLREQGYRGVVCIHSNRTSPDDFKVAVEAGADTVLPKPMSRTHFLKLMLQASQRPQQHPVQTTLAEPTVPEFALLDDSRLTLRAWQRKIGKDAILHVFTGPSEFRAHADANADFLSRLKFVVTDFYFAEGVLETGFSFAESLRPNFSKPIVLCSDGDFNSEMIKGHVDAVISKSPVTWSELSSKVSTGTGSKASME